MLIICGIIFNILFGYVLRNFVLDLLFVDLINFC